MFITEFVMARIPSPNLINLVNLEGNAAKLSKKLIKELGPTNGPELLFLRQFFKARQIDISQWIGVSQSAISQMEKSGESSSTPLPVWYALHCFFSLKEKKTPLSYEKYRKLQE